MSRFTRRAVLGGAAKAGALSVLGAASVNAAFSDRELFTGGDMIGGTVDLSLAYEAYTDDGQFAAVPVGQGLGAAVDDYVDTDGLGLTIPGIRPGDDGYLTTSFAVCSNPAYVWARLTGIDYENGVTEREALLGDSPTSDVGELAEYLEVTIWYDSDCDGVVDDDELVLATGPLADVLAGPLGTGVLLDGNVTTSGTPASDCEPLGKIEWDDEGSFSVEPDDPNDRNLGADRFLLVADDGSGAQAEIEISDVVYKDGDTSEVESFDFTVISGNVGICSVAVKGGADASNTAEDTTVYEFPTCVREGSSLEAPDARGVSNVVFRYCVETEPEPKECFEPCPEATCLSLAWHLPFETSHVADGDSVWLGLELAAEQCRYVTPSSPWPEVAQ